MPLSFRTSTIASAPASAVSPKTPSQNPSAGPTIASAPASAVSPTAPAASSSISTASPSAISSRQRQINSYGTTLGGIERNACFQAFLPLVKSPDPWDLGDAIRIYDKNGQLSELLKQLNNKVSKLDGLIAEITNDPELDFRYRWLPSFVNNPLDASQPTTRTKYRLISKCLELKSVFHEVTGRYVAMVMNDLGLQANSRRTKGWSQGVNPIDRFSYKIKNLGSWNDFETEMVNLFRHKLEQNREPPPDDKIKKGAFWGALEHRNIWVEEDGFISSAALRHDVACQEQAWITLWILGTIFGSDQDTYPNAEFISVHNPEGHDYERSHACVLLGAPENYCFDRPETLKGAVIVDYWRGLPVESAETYCQREIRKGSALLNFTNVQQQQRRSYKSLSGFFRSAH